MKTCRNHSSGSISEYPFTYNWLCLMRDFRQKHEEKCDTEAVHGPRRKTYKFLTGAIYNGWWHEGFGMHGYGVYTFSDGVVYEGEFSEGKFHGKGELHYHTSGGKAIIRGQWNNGVMTKRTLLFDGLEHKVKNWQYCTMPDRRFMKEYVNGMQPAGKSYLTACEPEIDVPEGYIDTGDGFFDMKTKMIYEHKDYTKILRSPTDPIRRSPSRPEQTWIQENCRLGKTDMIIGPRQDLYEKFIEPTLLLEPVQPPSAKFMSIAKKAPIFQQNEDDAPVFYDASKWGANARVPGRKFKPRYE